MISRAFVSRLTAGMVLISAAQPAFATPSVVIDADSGAVLSQNEANAPWYPASLTKLMTVYVALQAVRDGHLTLETPLKVSAKATKMPPSKMGFKPGTEVTLDNALKMLMVKSANDLAVTIAEGISGSVDDFATAMNNQADQLGMKESHFVNPNGLPSSRHVSSARDFALLARALLRDFPDHADLYGIGALDLNGRTIPTHNGMLGRYPGADGMKTGFTCAAGFNIVASATQHGRRLIAVVMGEPSAKARSQKAAELLDAGFGQRGSSGALESMERGSGTPPDMHGSACSRKTKGGSWVGEIEDFNAPIAQVRMPWDTAPAASANMAAIPRPTFDPVPVFIGRSANWNGAVLSASNPALKQVPASATAFAPPLKKLNAKPVQPAADEDVQPLQPDPAANPMALPGAVQEPAKKPAAAKVKVAAKPVKPVTLAKPPLKPSLAAVAPKPAVAKTPAKKPVKPKLLPKDKVISE